MLNDITRALLAADVSFELVRELDRNIRSKIKLDDDSLTTNLKRTIQSTVIHELHRLLDPDTKPYELKKGKSNVIMFVGLQGAGKTTTISKYARYYQKRGWKVGVVCADTFRAGAFDQLKQNATKAKIPFYGSYTELDPVVVAQAGVELFKKEKFELIIIDTSGRHKQEAALFEEMQGLVRATKPDDIVFVMDGSIGKSAKDQALAFKAAVPVGSVIITKLDGHAKGGGALSAVAATKAPIIFIGTGEHIHELEPFDAKSFVSRLLGMGDISGLLRMFEENKVMESSEQLVKKMVEGKKFTFKDMRDQFSAIMNMGSFSQILSMLPNMGLKFTAENERDTTAKFKQFLTITDSMNETELNSDDKIFAPELKEERKGNLVSVSIVPVATVRKPKMSKRREKKHQQKLKQAQAMREAGKSEAEIAKFLAKGERIKAKRRVPRSRLLRIAMGAGVHPPQIIEFLHAYKPFSELATRFGQLGKAGFDPAKLMQGGPAGLKAQQQAMSQMANLLPPNMMQQLGGPGGLQGMMKNMMQQLGGMDMGAMQRMMQGMGGGGKGMPNLASLFGGKK